MTERQVRREAVDVARVLALLIVVLGHLLLAVIDRPNDEVRGANLLDLHPGWAWVAAFAPMPLFFAAGGWANATSTLATAGARLRTLVGLGAVVVGTWSVAVVVAVIATGEPGVIGDGARVATQPLWFVAVYAPLAAAGGVLAKLARRNVLLVIGGCLAALAALDAARFAFDAPDWIGWPGFYAAWSVPWLAGGWWRARHERGDFDERRVGTLVALGAIAGCAVLVAAFDYDPALIDAVPGARSNTTPPTLYTAVASLAQVGLLLVAARALDGAGRRWRRLWARAGEAAVGVYAWHLTALALCAGVITAGFPVPDRLTVPWWLSRPVWWAAVLAVTGGLIWLTSVVRARIRRRDDRAAPPMPLVVAGVIAAAAGAALVGLRGPRSVALAVECSALFVAGWLLLRERRRAD